MNEQSNTENIESILGHLDRDFCHLAIFGILPEDIDKARGLIANQGLNILEERIFPHGRQQSQGLFDLFIKLPPCSMRDLIMDLSSAGIKGRFQGYNRHADGGRTTDGQNSHPAEGTDSLVQDGPATE